MRLAKVHVQDFRCVEDSGEFVLDQVTCLVGKNESGKTAILKALQKLKPDEASKESFVPSKDYPRRKWRPDTSVPSQPPALSTVWELSQADLAAIAKTFGEGVISSPNFTLRKSYDNVRRFGLHIDQERLLRNSLPEDKLSPEELAPLSSCKSVDELLKTLNALPNRSAAQEKLRVDLAARFPEGAEKAVITAVSNLVPTFLYFDEYLTLPGTVSLNQITTRKQQNSLTDRDRIFIALLGLAGTTLENVNGASTYEEFNASLRAVSNQITDMIFKYWSQNKHLDVDVRLDAARASDPPPFNEGWVFRTRIDNRRHRADTSFDDRSRGFVWFFSFLIWFYQLRKLHGDNLIILLDEPGLSLHARAQADLLRYINKELRPHYQVVYTTHSPFMIDADNLLSARTVEDVVVKDKATGDERLLGTKVKGDVLSTDVDTISPLQRALDYELTQTLFVGKHTLLLEGQSDLLFLKWFSRQLQLQGKSGLDYRWTGCICGGLARIPGFVSLFRGNGLHIAAIVDVQHGDKAKIDHARKSLADNHLLTLDTFAGQAEADIEDVIGREFYVSLVQRTFDLRRPFEIPTVKPADAPLRVAKEVERHMAAVPPPYDEYSHAAPAEWLVLHEDEARSLPGFDSAVVKMETLIDAINKLL